MSQIRLNLNLVKSASAVAPLYKRTTPKQIEYWAELGKAVDKFIDPLDVQAVIQGAKQIRVEIPSVPIVSMEEVLTELNTLREKGDLSQKIIHTTIIYEASSEKPGFLDRVNLSTGERQTGHFRNGKFEAE